MFMKFEERNDKDSKSLSKFLGGMRSVKSNTTISLLPKIRPLLGNLQGNEITVILVVDNNQRDTYKK